MTLLTRKLYRYLLALQFDNSLTLFKHVDDRRMLNGDGIYVVQLWYCARIKAVVAVVAKNGFLFYPTPQGKLKGGRNRFWHLKHMKLVCSPMEPVSLIIPSFDCCYLVNGILLWTIWIYIFNFVLKPVSPSFSFSLPGSMTAACFGGVRPRSAALQHCSSARPWCIMLNIY